MPRVALHTLGCKVNQYETRKIAEDFQARGFELVDFSDEADIYVINTCTVTRTADAKSRQAARAAAHRNPGAAVVVTGCYAETSREHLRNLDGISMVLGNREKDSLAERVVRHLRPAPAGIQSALRTPHSTAGRTRALLKIQDGCDQFCAYCAVPLARSNMMSRPPDDVLTEARDLAERGFKEIVLTGIRLGRFDGGLVELIQSITEIPGIERVRLSSIELTDVPDGLLYLMAENAKVCRHLHLPLQSGSDDVLARMNRPYTSAQFEEFTARARSFIPQVGITTDLIVGFPGETLEQFEATYRLVERMRFSRAHVFPYSPRPGTAAFDMKDGVSPQEKSRRKTRLASLAAAGMREFAAGLIGSTVKVLVEGKQTRPNLWSGLTDNYVRVSFEDGSGLAGEIVDVKVRSAREGKLLGVRN